MSALPPGCFGFHGAIHSFVLARDHAYRDLLATGKYVEVTGLDEMEADLSSRIWLRPARRS